MEQSRSARCNKQDKKGSSRAREWSLCLLLNDVSRWRCGEETKTCAKCACSLSEVDAEVPRLPDRGKVGCRREARKRYLSKMLLLFQHDANSCGPRMSLQRSGRVEVGEESWRCGQGRAWCHNRNRQGRSRASRTPQLQHSRQVRAGEPNISAEYLAS
jgi:hypothetical protein